MARRLGLGQGFGPRPDCAWARSPHAPDFSRMGFLDRKREEAEGRRALEGRVQRERDLELAILESQRKREREAAEAAYARSEAFLNASAFPRMLYEVASYVDGVAEHSAYLEGERRRFDRTSDNSSSMELVWEAETVYILDRKYRLSYKALVVEAQEDGTIISHGGFFGTTKLSRSKWENNEEVQENALQKAISRPLSVAYIKYESIEWSGP
jgi:hypothetical protein